MRVRFIETGDDAERGHAVVGEVVKVRIDHDRAVDINGNANVLGDVPREGLRPCEFLLELA